MGEQAVKHCMIDLETWGTAPGSAIRSIGAVGFDMEDRHITSSFYHNITDDSCTAAGLSISQSTREWWAKRPEAEAFLRRDAVPLLQAVTEFNRYWGMMRFECVWAHGASFDPVLWGVASNAVAGNPPWDHRNIRDTRTILDLGDVRLGDREFVGVPHYAIDDCLHQIKGVQEAYRRLFHTHEA